MRDPPEHATVCRRCHKRCCEKPLTITGDEYDQMIAVMGYARVEEGKPGFHYEIRGRDGSTLDVVTFEGTCPALTARGCLLLYDQRPEVCRFYPFVRVGDRLLLDQRCEHWRIFGEDYRDLVK
jgi:Fe-S-cluster containining protein